jgi:hypothetical protein
MWESGSRVRLTQTATGSWLDLLVDASYANAKTRPLMLSPPSSPFSRLRPDVAKGTKSFAAGGGGQTPTPVATDGRCVGRDSLWLVRIIESTPLALPGGSSSAGPDSTENTARIESVGHPGLFLSIDAGARLLCSACPPQPDAAHQPATDSDEPTGSRAAAAAARAWRLATEFSFRPVPGRHTATAGASVFRADAHDPMDSLDESPFALRHVPLTEPPAAPPSVPAPPPPPPPPPSQSPPPLPDRPSPTLLKQQDLLAFAEEGFAVIRRGASPALWRPAAASIFGAIGRPGAIVTGGDESNTAHAHAGKLAGAYMQTPQMKVRGRGGKVLQ